MSLPLQREGLHAHLLALQQQVVDAIRKLPGKQEWLSRLLLQLALAQLEVAPFLLMPVCTLTRLKHIHAYRT